MFLDEADVLFDLVDVEDRPLLDLDDVLEIARAEIRSLPSKSSFEITGRSRTA